MSHKTSWFALAIRNGMFRNELTRLRISASSPLMDGVGSPGQPVSALTQPMSGSAAANRSGNSAAYLYVP